MATFGTWYLMVVMLSGNAYIVERQLTELQCTSLKAQNEAGDAIGSTYSCIPEE